MALVQSTQVQTFNMLNELNDLKVKVKDLEEENNKFLFVHTTYLLYTVLNDDVVSSSAFW